MFDSHSHYTDGRFAPDRGALLRELPRRGVELILTCGVDLRDSAAALELAHAYAHVYAACGIHPHEAAGVGNRELAALQALLPDARCVALGEIGLDYHYDFSPREQQREAFRWQLALAAEFRMPVVVHDREAHEDTLRLLQEFYSPCAVRPGVVHCFSGSLEFAREILELGFFLGFGGAVTFRNARRPLAVAAAVPLERLLLETDAPYVTPEPLRGRRCDSAHIALTAEKIAAARGMDAQELVNICNKNARNLFFGV
jgi:TatD DNase family protein